MEGQLLSPRTLLPRRDEHGRVMKEIPMSHRSDSLRSAVGPQDGMTNTRAGTGEIEEGRGETMFNLVPAVVMGVLRALAPKFGRL